MADTAAGLPVGMRSYARISPSLTFAGQRHQLIEHGPAPGDRLRHSMENHLAPAGGGGVEATLRCTAGPLAGPAVAASRAMRRLIEATAVAASATIGPR